MQGHFTCLFSFSFVFSDSGIFARLPGSPLSAHPGEEERGAFRKFRRILRKKVRGNVFFILVTVRTDFCRWYVPEYGKLERREIQESPLPEIDVSRTDDRNENRPCGCGRTRYEPGTLAEKNIATGSPH